jgi:hypothetical protein
MHTVMSRHDPAALELVKEAERGRDAARRPWRCAAPVVVPLAELDDSPR